MKKLLLTVGFVLMVSIAYTQKTYYGPNSEFSNSLKSASYGHHILTTDGNYISVSDIDIDKIEELVEYLETQKRTIIGGTLAEGLQSQKKTIEDLEKEVDDQRRTIDDLKRTIDDLQRTVNDLQRKVQ